MSSDATNRFTEKTVSEKRVFDGRLLKVDSIEVELPDGRKSVREVVRHPGAAVVLLRGEKGEFVFVRQFRKATEKVMLEIVAGTLEEGEDPEECARREVGEEAGMTVTSIEELGVVFPAPGYTSEKLHIYFAEASEGGEGFTPDEDENIERVFLSEAAIDGMVAEGSIDDAKTLAAWLLYKGKKLK
jgi:ADP-ribose pyrophosphatase